MWAWRQRDVTSIAVAAGAASATDADVAAALDLAAARGLAATLFPIVILDVVAPGQWRGTLAPADVDAWW